MDIVIKTIAKKNYIYLMDTWNRPIILKITDKYNLLSEIKNIQYNHDINEIRFILKSPNLDEDLINHI